MPAAGAPEQVTLAGDADVDGLSDLIHFKRGTPGCSGQVYVSRNTSSGSFALPVLWNSFFCIGSELPLTGDFNGDGRTDIATFVRSTQPGIAKGDVYVALSTGFQTARDKSSLLVTWSGPLAAENVFATRLEVSTDLQTWSAAPSPARGVSGAFVFYTTAIPLSGNARRYVRLVADSPGW